MGPAIFATARSTWVKGRVPIPMNERLLVAVARSGCSDFGQLERRAPPPGQLWPEEEKAMGHSEHDPATKERHPWNVGRKVGAKRALKPQQVWAIRFWLDRERRLRDRAMFDLATDSKLRGCDVVKVEIGDLVSGSLLAKYGGGCRAGSARAANPCSNAIRRLRLAARDPPPWSRCAP
jgi:hypothetical protein